MTITDIISADLDTIFTDGLTLTATHVNGDTNETFPVFLDFEMRILMDDVGIETARISIHCKTSDIGNVNRDSTITVNSVDYTVLEMGPDESGVTTIILSRD